MRFPVTYRREGVSLGAEFVGGYVQHPVPAPRWRELHREVIKMAPCILLYDKAGKLVGVVKDGILVDEKGREVREIADQSIKLSDLIKELVQRKVSGYVS